MRFKPAFYIVFTLLFICSVSTATASLVRLAYPAGDLAGSLPDIQPAYGAQDGVSNNIGYIKNTSADTYGMYTGNGLNASDPGSIKLKLDAAPAFAIPDPADFMQALAPSGSADAAAKADIYGTLVGKNLTYYSIAGMPMNYTITRDGIKGINRTTYQGKPAWKVRVGEGMAWDLTMDASGKKILATKQLFYT